jgi:hypothetical protein
MYTLFDSNKNTFKSIDIVFIVGILAIIMVFMLYCIIEYENNSVEYIKQYKNLKKMLDKYGIENIIIIPTKITSECFEFDVKVIN